MKSFWPLIVCMVSALTLEPTSVAAQQTDDASGLRFGVNAGGVVYRTGDDRNCPTGTGFAAGVEVRSRGTWLVAAGADVLAATSFACTSALSTTNYQGQDVEVYSGASFPFAPRAGVRIGRTGELFEAAIRAGYLLMKNDFFPEDKWSGSPVIGADVSLFAGRKVALQFVYEQFQVPTRYMRDREVVHEFNSWKPMYRLGVVF